MEYKICQTQNNNRNYIKENLLNVNRNKMIYYKLYLIIELENKKIVKIKKLLI